MQAWLLLRGLVHPAKEATPRQDVSGKMNLDDKIKNKNSTEKKGRNPIASDPIFLIKLPFLVWCSRGNTQ
jgi:hypothetical protein